MIAPVTRPDPDQVLETKPPSGADEAQRRASDPSVSAWVGASAGTGKTKVLTDRVMRLLLPRPDGSPGTPPHKILCLTYTKAAAGEMALRISAALGRWAVMNDTDLDAALRALLGHDPGREVRAAARRLFAAVVDAPGGLKIMTLHSFCKSVLSRFPLEAGVLPGFRILADGEADLLFSDSIEAVLRQAQTDPSGSLGDSLARLAGVMDEIALRGSLRALCAERLQLRAALTRHFGIEGLYTALCRDLGHDPGQTSDTIRDAACREAAFDAPGLREAAQALGRVKGVKSVRTAARLAAWCAACDGSRADHFADHEDVFFTHDGNLRKQIYPKEIERNQPDIARILDVEAARLDRVREAIRAARCAGMTRALLHPGVAVLEAYEAAKTRCAALDYEDLILRTLGLLDGASVGMVRARMVPWVMYKLDQGLDHILIDEAQDTNPEQWRIVEALADDFFSGLGARDDLTRTIFTVGDEKQSIFSFQRAAPDRFAAMRASFSEKITRSGANMEHVALDLSFRSTPSVLQLVDAVFADLRAAQGLGTQGSVHHRSHRAGQAGCVELWPVFAPPDKDTEKESPWTPPLTVRDAPTGAARAAEAIATRIQEWIAGGDVLASHNRTIQAGDILILVRTRTPFVGQLVRALKVRGVPVTGVDRMVLTDQLAVQDLLALARFALLPEDDLTLACVLKSPFVGMDEEGLYALAQARSGTLWEALKEDKAFENKGIPVVAWLRGLIARAGTQSPYEFFAGLLQEPCPADPQGSGLRAVRGRLGEDVLDPLDELLNAALAHEDVQIPSVQGFVHWIDRDAPEIKRELEEAQGRVRIMTVHGSKGLQAPIVILPDTLRAGSARRNRILWQDKSGLSVPVWSARREDDPAPYRAAAERIAAREDEEYRRLLYVALTRAEDRLYVTGFRGARAPSGEGWYDWIARGFEAIGTLEKRSTPEGDILRVTNPQTDAPDRKPRAESVMELESSPAWLWTPPAPEPDPPRPLVPTRPAAVEPAAISPLAEGDAHRFRRGILTHRLLQFLPDLGISAQQDAAFAYLERQAGDLPEIVKVQIAQEVLAILRHPDHADVFGPGSMAEVPVTGLVGGRIVSGQIDRLLVTPQLVRIVDFKTNRPPPLREEDVPAAYKAQLRAYRDALRLIWPDRPVRCALLWTDGPRMMDVAV
jgi:ATP-dependent helicase/nuclease subunit A